MSVIANFSVEFYQCLKSNGTQTKDFPSTLNNPALLRHLFRYMQQLRLLDQKAVNLQRTGRMGTYPSSLGQEAVSVGAGFALKKTDVVCPYYRDQGLLMQRGVNLATLLAYWGGDERGTDYPNNPEDFPPSIPIATQNVHAAGIAYAIALRKQARAVLTSIGEGGTSEGAFYEALNFAGAFQLPMVCIVNNNQWAISVPRTAQTQTKTIAQKAIAAGIDHLQVDGNDVVAVYSATDKALQQARSGKGPTLIEAVTYRLCDHTTADDATRYGDKAALEAAWKKEPLLRLRQYLTAEHHWSEAEEKQMITECEALVNQAADDYLAMQPQENTAIIDYLYATLPKAYQSQRKEIASLPTQTGGH